MRVVIIWREESDYARSVIEWMHDFERATGRELESLNPDTREGEAFCKTYDIVEYPSIIAIASNGSVQQLWRGRMLPLMNEVSYYLMND